jgi:hypothetical protein
MLEYGFAKLGSEQVTARFEYRRPGAQAHYAAAAAGNIVRAAHVQDAGFRWAAQPDQTRIREMIEGTLLIDARRASAWGR